MLVCYFAGLYAVPCLQELASTDPYGAALQPEVARKYVNVREHLRDARHLLNLSHGCMPCGSATDSLVTKGEQLKKKGVTDPFVFVNLSDFLPQWCGFSEAGLGGHALLALV